jgi:ribosomal protein L12E/L44/L45/RPP1/RPP2
MIQCKANRRLISAGENPFQEEEEEEEEKEEEEEENTILSCVCA